VCQEAKGDFSDAAALLMDASSRQRLEAEFQAACATTACSSTDTPRGDDINHAEDMLQPLRELFPTASATELMNAIEASGRCHEVAVDILLDHYDEVAGGAHKTLAQDFFVQEMTEDAAKTRMFEETLAETNFLIRLIHFVEDTIRTCNQRCLVCNDPIDYISLRPVVCPKPVCIMSTCEYPSSGW
jgi:hypothetical protein